MGECSYPCLIGFSGSLIKGEKLKVTFVNPNQHTRYPQPPMGIALLAAVLQRGNYEVEVIDANALNLNYVDIIERIHSNIVCLTAMTPGIDTAIKTAKFLKTRYNLGIKIILGGPHASLLPQETLDACPEINILVKGEGESILPTLLSSANLNERRIIQGVNAADLDSLPVPAYDLLPLKSYNPHPPHGLVRPFLPVITSRGCPYHCVYCSKPVFGQVYRAQSPEKVVSDLQYLIKKFGIREIGFYDDVFTLDKKRTHAICDMMIEKGLKVIWSCETRVNLVDKELLKHMKEAGCYAVSYGIESGSSRILDGIDKGINLGQVSTAVQWAKQAGIEVIGYFMVGSPGETPETIRETVDFAKKLKLNYAQFAVTTPYPGTKLYELYQQGYPGAKINWKDFAYTGSKQSPVFDSKALSREDIYGWASRAYKEFYLRPAYILQRLQGIKSFNDVMLNAKGVVMLAGVAK